MIEDCQSEIPDYTLFSSQVAANTLFYCTFNVKSAPPLASCGSLTQMISITRHLLVTERGNTALRLEFSANYSVVTFFSWIKLGLCYCLKGESSLRKTFIVLSHPTNDCNLSFYYYTLTPMWQVEVRCQRGSRPPDWLAHLIPKPSHKPPVPCQRDLWVGANATQSNEERLEIPKPQF